MWIMDLIRPELKQINEYTPCADTMDYRLHANESPWAPINLETIALNQYPDINEQFKLQKQLAAYYQVQEDQLVLTRGSDDGLDFLMRLFLSSGKDSILQCPPTFPMYSFYAQLQQAKVINCTLMPKAQFKLSLKTLFAAWEPNCKLIMLCQPNNPTGNLLSLEELAAVCEHFNQKAMVVVDEAYIEFATCSSATTLLATHDNLIVLRTLSKAFGLAGLRLGCVMANRLIIGALKKIMAPYLLPSPVIALAQQALTKPDWLITSVEQIIAERERVSVFLQQLSCVDTVYPSEANFLFIQSNNTPALINWLTQHNLAIRHFLDTPLASFLRITIGDKAQNQFLMKLMQQFNEKNLATT